VSDSAITVSQARVARLAGVTRAAVTQWRKRHADYPAPVDGDGDRFDLDDVIGWLDRRPIPAGSRAPHEGANATYGDRVRRRLRPAERPDAHSPFRSLLALSSQVCGDAPHSDYLYLLLCLAFLRLHDQDRWVQLTRAIPPSGDPGEARRLLQRVVAAVDRSLGYPDLLKGPDAPPTRLRPNAFEPVRKVMELAADLLPSDFRRLRAAFLREVGVRRDAISTPASVTRTMAALLAGHTARGNVTLYDPFARFGELAVEFVQKYADRAAVRVGIEHPYSAELRLAGIRLAAAGTRAELAMTPSPPSGGATFLITNPPFGGQHRELEWLQRCVASLAEDGRAAVLMPYSAGFDVGARARDVRRELVEHGAVLAVVALPARMFRGSSVGVCIWLLRRPTGHAAPVQLVDARKLGQQPGTWPMGVHVLDAADTATIAATVTASELREGFSVLAAPDEIRARGYSLHPPEYQDRTLAPTAADAARAELDVLFEDLSSPSYTTGGDAGWPRHRLCDLCDIRTGVPHSSLKRPISRARTAREAVPVVHPRHLRDGLIRAGDAPDADVAALERYRLQTGDVLWVRTGAMGQTAIVRLGESGWLRTPTCSGCVSTKQPS
jgi:type I restriction enzyme M protein